MNNRYSARIHWSEQDGCFIAIVDELPGCVADGQTHQEVLSNLGVIIDEWIEVAKEEGRPIPEPLTMEAFDRMLRKSREDLEQKVQAVVEEAVSKAMSGDEANPSSAAPEHLWPLAMGNH